MAFGRWFAPMVLVIALLVPSGITHARTPLVLATQAASPASVIELRVTSWAPPGHLLREGLAAWCDELQVRSRESVRCRWMEKAEVGISETHTAVADGQVDIALVVHSLDPDRYVLTRLAELPLQAGTAEQVSVAYYRTWQKHLRQQSEHAGVRVLTVFTQTAGDLYTAVESVQRVSHLSGLSISAGGGTGGQVLRQLAAVGIEPKRIPLPATLHAITDHELDGVLTTAGNVHRYGLVATMGHRWQVPGGFYRHSYGLLMNPAAYAGLPKAAKKALADMSGETAARLFGRAADRLEQNHRELLQNAGLLTIAATPGDTAALAKRLKRISDAWLTEARARGLFNAAEVLRDFRRDISRQQPQ
ncbi:MAG: hypothetical protein AB8C46_17880 [Burkholderiaceae bacterium]